MAAAVPIKFVTNESGTVVFSDFEEGDVVSVESGGTGVTTLEALVDLLSGTSAVPLSNNNIAGTAYTVQSTDTGKRLLTTSTADVVITLPSGLTDIEIGDYVEVSRYASGRVFFTNDGTSVVNSRNDCMQVKQLYGVVRATYMGSNTWHLSGDLIAGKAYNRNWTFATSYMVSGTSTNYVATKPTTHYYKPYSSSYPANISHGDKYLYLYPTTASGYHNTYAALILNKGFVPNDVTFVSTVDKKVGLEITYNWIKPSYTDMGGDGGGVISLCFVGAIGAYAYAAGVTITNNGVYSFEKADGDDFGFPTTNKVGFVDYGLNESITVRIELENNQLTIWVNDEEMSSKLNLSLPNNVAPAIYERSGNCMITSIRGSF